MRVCARASGSARIFTLSQRTNK